MKIRKLFPKFNVPILFENLKEVPGQYWPKSDTIVLDKELKTKLPGCAKLVFLHEMIHATASSKRLMRFQRLQENLDTYEKGSVSFRTEEIIAEIGAMVAALKLGILNKYNRSIFLDGIHKHYEEGMKIPWKEVVDAVKYFANDRTDFNEELAYVKKYLQLVHKIRFTETYSSGNSAA